MATQQLLFDIFARSQGVEKTFDSIVSSADAMESKLGPAGQRASKALSSPILLGGAAAIGGAVVGLGAQFGQMAATAEQNAGAVGTVFGTAAGDVEGYATRAADAVGLSSSAYNELSAVTGTALKSAGVPMDELAKKNDELITRGADLASVFGGTTTEAVGAMGAAFRGEFDSLERYGLTLTAAQVEAELAARGQDNLGGAALEAAKKQATMDLIMQQSATSAGNFAKESDTAAGAQERQAAAFENAGAKLGETLLPAMTKLAEIATAAATWISQNAGLVTGFAIALGVLAGVIGILSAAVTVMNIVMALNPMTWIIVGVIALIAALALLIANWDVVVAWISTVWGGFLTWLQGVVGGFVGWWNGLWAGFAGWMQALWAGLVGFLQAAWQGYVAWITAVVVGFMGWWNGFWAGFAGFFQALWAGLVGVVQGLWQGYVAWITGVVAGFMGWWNGMWNGFTSFFQGLWAGLVGVVQGIWQGYVGWLTGVVSGFMGWWNGMWTAITSFLTGAWQNMVAGATQMGSNLFAFFSSIPGRILAVLSGAGSWLLSTGQNLVSGLMNGITGTIGRVWSFLGGLAGSVTGAVSGAGSWLYSTGTNLIQGLVNGVQAMAGRIRDAVRGVIGNVVDFAKDILGIASPSKVFTVIGQQTGEGYAVGLGRMGARVNAEMERLIAPPDAATISSSMSPTSALAARDSDGRVPTREETREGNTFQFFGDLFGSAEQIIDEVDKRKRRANVLTGTRRIIVEV
ncbi:hypothetical protein [Arthrobacter sp. B1805]|uniref:phage tail protein n=1 Tax=Arthrobacter sp. B1805 TaxID=2058892 RepID=UPI0011B090A1|nr:hypothetical protein [Arthrobacter sp. B1805]